MGVAGGAAGFLLLAQSVVYLLFVRTEDSRFVAIPLILVACAYLPAVWASIVPTTRRQTVLRWVLGVTLVPLAFGAIFVNIQLAVLMLFPTTLLAIGGSLVFQGGSKR